jgi:hypothetical protein
MARFDVDQAAVRRACRFLGLKRGVKVTRHYYENYDGRYIGVRSGLHRIGIASDLSPREASMTLWHELMHAKQAECLGGHPQFERQWWGEMRAAGLSRVEAARADGARYSRTPMEREARSAEKNHVLLPLARRIRHR